MESVILQDARRKIREFDSKGLHYNLVANRIYEKLDAPDTDHFDDSYLKYIVAGLVSFDMGRMMGDRRYEFSSGGFAFRLSSKLQEIRSQLGPLMDLSLAQADLQQHRDNISKAYNALSSGEDGALHEQGKAFHVGATKILHFLNPDFFIIVDSNAARAFQMAHNVQFRNTTQPGYKAERYLECMRHAQKDILTYGVKGFQDLDPGVPITRIYDKLTFVTGSELSKAVG